MEKAESGQFSILSFLLQESQTTVKAVMEETGFSKATLTKYVTLLNEKALDSGLELTIHLEDENLRLSIGAATKGRDIRSLFLENAVKYQILVYLLYHQQFLAHQLAQELMISEATLGRHLASLNQILSEFDLSIQNGRWQRSRASDSLFLFLSFPQGLVQSGMGRPYAETREKTGDCYTRRNLRCKFVFGAEIGPGSLGSHQSTTSPGQCLSVSSHRRKNARVF